MRVHSGIPGCAGQVFSIAVRDVLTCLGVSEPLGQAEIDDVDEVLLLLNSNEEVVRLDVSVQEVPGVNEFKSLQLVKYNRSELSLLNLMKASIKSMDTILLKIPMNNYLPSDLRA